MGGLVSLLALPVHAPIDISVAGTLPDKSSNVTSFLADILISLFRPILLLHKN